MIAMGEMWSQVSTAMASAMFVYAMVQQYFPHQLRAYFEQYTQKWVGFFFPYIQITFPEYTGDGFRRSHVYRAIQTYLSANSYAKAKRFRADDVKDSKAPTLSIAYNEEVTDEFQGIKLWWTSNKNKSNGTTFSWYPASDEKKYYKLTFHRNYRDIITGSYLSHIINEGKALDVKNRQRKLYTNSSGEGHWDGGRRTRWSHVVFEHPSTFDTLAMDPKKKEDIINDLVKFRKGKEYYAKIGKAWKRGYLLYGPPGTGKSTMIAAMANFMDYDIYDLELTAVRDNTELRKLLIDTSNKSIMVIEDIDCSLDLTGQRKKEKKKEKEGEEKRDPMKKKIKEEEEESKKSKVTLSGLLNFIDGIWSACGGERLIIFTTNYVDKLDPALIRRGRMDKHIELSYCSFEAFKVLAHNYLDVDSHPLFETIEAKLGEINITPADVAESLMPNALTEDADSCLKNLIEAIEKTKVEAEERKKVEEEMKLKAEKEAAELKAKEEQEKEAKKNEEVAKEDVKCNGNSDKEHVKENGNIA